MQFLSRATDGVRTRDPDLGKVVLYQLSHCRVSLFSVPQNNNYYTTATHVCQQLFLIILLLFYYFTNYFKTGFSSMLWCEHYVVFTHPLGVC